jgi:Fur family ferric uptake transcriptional regulator
MSGRNLPLTPQRSAIAELLLGSERELSIEEIVEELARRGVKAGTATVYRTIDVLLESGFIEERNRGEGFRRFEVKRELPHHEQLLCTQCGRVEEFRDPALERVTSRAAEARGFQRERHRVVVYGVCAACLQAALPAAAGARA